MSWDWEHAWSAFGMTFLAAIVVWFLCLCFADKTVRGYSGTCVVASVNWDADSTSFCSPDVDKVLDVLAKANASLKK
jgi:hypothetical protein